MKWNVLSRKTFTMKKDERLLLKSWQTQNSRRNCWSRWTMHSCLCRWIPRNTRARQNLFLFCTSMLRGHTRFSRKRRELLRLRFLNRGRCPCLTSWSRSRNRKSSQPPQRLRNPARNCTAEKTAVSCIWKTTICTALSVLMPTTFI